MRCYICEERMVNNRFVICDGCVDVLEDSRKPKTDHCDPSNSSELLSAIRVINGICKNTAELSEVHTIDDAMNCDQALTDILYICEEVLKKYPEGN